MSQKKYAMRNPEKHPKMEAQNERMGVATLIAIKRGTTRYCTGGIAIDLMALTSSHTLMFAISAATALPERPARMMVVRSGPISAKMRKPRPEAR